MSDLIDRQAAIDALESIRHGLWLIDIPHPNCSEYVEHHEQITDMMQIADKCIKEISDMPSAQPERNKGVWFKEDEGTFICSACGSGYKDQPTIMGRPMFIYCPICGADMREES